MRITISLVAYRNVSLCRNMEIAVPTNSIINDGSTEECPTDTKTNEISGKVNGPNPSGEPRTIFSISIFSFSKHYSLYLVICDTITAEKAKSGHDSGC
jgi:hypothetical protein